jgi:DNA polymerase-3 subunit chi
MSESFPKKISFYRAIPDLLDKSICLIAEKCYLNGLRAVVLAADSELQESLNNKLWTYSKKQFIPHGSSNDPLPQLQPIFITTQIQNPNQSTVLITVNCLPELSASEEYGWFERVIIIYTDTATADFLSEISVIQNNPKNSYKIEHFQQNIKGQWSLIE